MKQLLRLSIFLLAMLFAGSMVNAQCIDKFPYTYDFENFDSLQTTESCDGGVKGDTADGWIQDQTDGGEWRADTAGTGSIGTGPGATDTTNGVGVGTDYMPGTTKGVYLYTEATSATGCPGANISLISPCFDFSASGKYYRLKFAYNMFGAGIASLHVDVYDGSNWTDSVWTLVGDQGQGWKVATVNLANYNGTDIQVRIRAVMGNSYLSDIAIDAITVEEYSPYKYDAILTDNTSSEYHFTPIRHVQSFNYSGIVKNEGVDSITSVQLKYTSSSGDSDSISIGTIESFGLDTSTFSKAYTPGSIADSTVKLEVTLKETDGDYSNNSVTLKTNVTQSIYSRDKGTVSGGIGFNGTAGLELGQTFELKQADTLTSISVYLDGTLSGDSCKAFIRSMSGGVPSTNILYTSETIVATGGEEWRTIKFACEPTLSAGEYFISVQQLTTNNLNLGYGNDCWTPGTAMYWSGAAWVRLEDNATPFYACFLIRLNLDGPELPQTSIAVDDTICAGDITLAKGSGADSYLWGPKSVLSITNVKDVNFKSDTSFTLTLKGTNKCGYSTSVSKHVHVEGKPSAMVSNDTIVCKSEKVTLTANTNNNYRWINGPSNMDHVVNPTSSTTYTVEVDSTNGCTKKYNIDVDVSIPEPVVNNDTTVCEAQPLLLQASGGSSYQWMNGPAASKYAVRPTTNTDYVVTVTDNYGCSENDTVSVTVSAGPDITTNNDTAVCFGQRVTFRADGANTYEWTNGPNSATWTTTPIISKYFYVKGTDVSGCYLFDSVYVEVALIPKVSVRNDTTICEGTSLELNAATDDDVTFDWSTGETSQKINVSPTSETKYKVVVANPTGCTAADSVTISIDPLPRISFDYAVNKRSVTFTNNSTGGSKHLWVFGDGDSSTSAGAFHRYDIDGDYNLTYTIANDCGSVDTSFSIKIENLSVGSLDYKRFEIAPIPASNSLDLMLDNDTRGDVVIELISLDGKRVFSAQIDKSNQLLEYQIDVSSLTDGVYMIYLKAGNGSLAKRVVVQH